MRGSESCLQRGAQGGEPTVPRCNLAPPVPWLVRPSFNQSVAANRLRVRLWELGTWDCIDTVPKALLEQGISWLLLPPFPACGMSLRAISAKRLVRTQLQELASRVLENLGSGKSAFTCCLSARRCAGLSEQGRGQSCRLGAEFTTAPPPAGGTQLLVPVSPRLHRCCPPPLAGLNPHWAPAGLSSAWHSSSVSLSFLILEIGQKLTILRLCASFFQ